MTVGISQHNDDDEDPEDRKETEQLPITKDLHLQSSKYARDIFL